MSTAVEILRAQADRYAKEYAHLDAQRIGLERKIASTQAKLDATKEALDALEGMTP